MRGGADRLGGGLTNSGISKLATDGLQKQDIEGSTSPKKQECQVK